MRYEVQLLLFLFYIIHCAIPLPVLQSIIEYQKQKNAGNQSKQERKLAKIEGKDGRNKKRDI